MFNGCWGLGLREVSWRLISASKISPNLSAGPRWLGDKYARRMIGAFQDLRRIKELTFGRTKVTLDHPEAQAQRSIPAKHLRNHLREIEGDDWSLRSTSPGIKTCEASRRPPSGDRRWRLITQKQKLEDQNMWRFSTPEGYQIQNATRENVCRTFVGSRRACKMWIREKVGFVHLSPCNFTLKTFVSEL